jgi:hypothetical protein
MLQLRALDAQTGDRVRTALRASTGESGKPRVGMLLPSNATVGIGNTDGSLVKESVSLKTSN